MSEHAFQSVPLLFPIMFTLRDEEYTLLEPYVPLLATFGIVFESVGPMLFKVSSLPVFLKNESIELIIREFLSWLVQEGHVTSQALYVRLTEKLRALVACKSAVKAGDQLSSEIIQYLLKQYYRLTDSFTCPHGRPLRWRMSLSELEKKFKRDYR